MVPSAGCGAAAFVVSPANNNFQQQYRGSSEDERGSRTISSSLQSSSSAFSAIAESYNENNNNNNNDSIFSSRGGHQSYQSTEIQQKQQRVPRPDEPNLYDIPSIISPTYRPLPFLVRVLINLSSAAINWKKFITLTSTIHHRHISANFKNVMSILVRYLLVSSVAKLCLQEVMYPPSRVTTKYLAENDLLPSKLSRYQFVTPVAIIQDVIGGGGGDASNNTFPTQSTQFTSITALAHPHSHGYQFFHL